MKGDEECAPLGNLAGQIAASRDAGQSLVEVQQSLLAMMESVKGREGYIVQDDEDEKMILGMAEYIYSTHEPPEMVAEETYAGCLRSSSPTD